MSKTPITDSIQGCQPPSETWERFRELERDRAELIEALRLLCSAAEDTLQTHADETQCCTITRIRTISARALISRLEKDRT